MADSVQKNEGLTQLFLKKAQADGFTGTVDSDKWQDVMSVFDEIQTDKGKSGERLYRGGHKKTHANWHKNYVVDENQEISVTDVQLKKIYKAMGFTKEEKKVGAPVTNVPKQSDVDSNAAAAKLDAEKKATEKQELHDNTDGKARDVQLKNKATGHYQIKSTFKDKENDSGFTIENDIEIKDGGEAKKFFNDEPKYDKKTKEYSVRGVKAKDKESLTQAVSDEAHDISLENLVYADLKTKQGKSEKFTEPEKTFMAYYPTKLTKNGLALNEKGEIIDAKEASKPKTNVSGSSLLTTARATVKRQDESSAPAPSADGSKIKENPDGSRVIEVPGTTTVVNVPGRIVGEFVEIPGHKNVFKDPKSGDYFSVNNNKATKLSAEQLKELGVLTGEHEAAPQILSKTSEDSSKTAFDAGFRYKITRINDVTKAFDAAYTPGKYDVVQDKNSAPLRTWFEKKMKYDEKSSTWSLDGIQGMPIVDRGLARSKADFLSNDLYMKNFIYLDLVKKSNSGQMLTDEERQFMNSHLVSLKIYGLKLDDNNNIVIDSKK